jgi:hypothetical protein
MTQRQTSPAVSILQGTKNRALVYVTRATITQILIRFCDEVKSAKDLSPFVDRIMEELAEEGELESISFDPKAPVGERFQEEITK